MGFVTSLELVGNVQCMIDHLGISVSRTKESDHTIITDSQEL
jgi:hypothetical protein